MKIFFGGAIQGQKERGERAMVYKTIMDAIRDSGHSLYSEHVSAKTVEEVVEIQDKRFGSLPPLGTRERRVAVRKLMIEGVEGDIIAAIFEVSVPSLGTGVELAHAYLRPRMGLSAIPVLALYQKDYWPNKLSTMIQGVTKEEVPNFHLAEYQSLDQLKPLIANFLNSLS